MFTKILLLLIIIFLIECTFSEKDDWGYKIIIGAKYGAM